ncbi:hypothetical protein GGI17_000866 [Coemansia sp. S146]|nr:hypothetical protein GGI17_000866 [Coemansia sp. S146]
MSTNLDKSLDDIIGETPRRGGRRGNRQNNNNNNRDRGSPNRNSPYSRRDGGVQKRGSNNAGGGVTKQQQAIMFNPAAFMAAAQQQQQQQQGGGSSGRIHISNLDYAVSEADIRALFGQVGPVNKATLNYGPNGKSKGTGEVQFRNPAHAAQAVEKYHGVTLDGRPMRIEIAFNPMAVAAAGMMMPAMVPAPVVAQQPSSGNTRGRRGAGSNNNSGNANAGGNRSNNAAGGRAAGGNASGGNASGGRAGGRGRRGRRNDSDKRSPMSKEALDADLDSYMQDAEKSTTA